MRLRIHSVCHVFEIRFRIGDFPVKEQQFDYEKSLGTTAKEG